MNYPLSLDDARHLFTLATVTEDRTDDEHAALSRLAHWLDSIDGNPGTSHTLSEHGVTTTQLPTHHNEANTTRR